MAKGTNLIREMDTMIKKINKNQTIDICYDDTYEGLTESSSKWKESTKKNYSKGVMKKIINN